MTLDPNRDYVTDPRGHVWVTLPEEDGGGINFFAQDAEFHNGPQCAKCGFTFCEHCDPRPIPPCDVPEGDSNALA